MEIMDLLAWTDFSTKGLIVRAHCFHGEYGAVLEVILKMIM